MTDKILNKLQVFGKNWYIRVLKSLITNLQWFKNFKETNPIWRAKYLKKSNFSGKNSYKITKKIRKKKNKQFQFQTLSIRLDCHFEFSESDSRCIISDSENPCIPIFSKFSTILDPPFWIFQIWQQIRNQWTEKPVCIYFFSKNWNFFKILFVILDPPFCNLQIWQKIRNQRPQKPLNIIFHE